MFRCTQPEMQDLLRGAVDPTSSPWHGKKKMRWDRETALPTSKVIGNQQLYEKLEDDIKKKELFQLSEVMMAEVDQLKNYESLRLSAQSMEDRQGDVDEEGSSGKQKIEHLSSETINTLFDEIEEMLQNEQTCYNLSYGVIPFLLLSIELPPKRILKLLELVLSRPDFELTVADLEVLPKKAYFHGNSEGINRFLTILSCPWLPDFLNPDVAECLLGFLLEDKSNVLLAASFMVTSTPLYHSVRPNHQFPADGNHGSYVNMLKMLRSAGYTGSVLQSPPIIPSRYRDILFSNDPIKVTLDDEVVVSNFLSVLEGAPMFRLTEEALGYLDKYRDTILKEIHPNCPVQ